MRFSPSRTLTARRTSGNGTDIRSAPAMPRVSASFTFAPAISNELLAYLTATGAWTGTPQQLQAKVPGLVHLIAGTPEYQFV